MPAVPTGVDPTALTADEEVTLRRVAFGQSEVRAMRTRDLARLQALQLIEDGKDGPRLTLTGKKLFAGLPRPSAQLGAGSFENVLAQLTKLLDDTRR